MTHVKQKDGAGTCGAVAYAAILGLTELQGIRECKTIMRGRGAGTRNYDLRQAFKNRGIATHGIVVDHEKLKQLFWLPLLSAHFPLYVSTSERKHGTSHAVAIMSGHVFDGHYDHPVPLDVYPNVFVESIIVIEKELDTYGKN
jgi:hypothetical protein